MGLVVGRLARRRLPTQLHHYRARRARGGVEGQARATRKTGDAKGERRPRGTGKAPGSRQARTSITGNTGGPASYIYDADGNLLEKNPGHTILYLPGQQVTLNTSTNTASSVRYYPLPGGATALRAGSGTNYKFSIADHHGTGELLLDTPHKPCWRQHIPFGAPRGTAITWPTTAGSSTNPSAPEPA